MTTNNKALWDSVKTTDPRRVKAITGKQYKGNSPQPYWIVERLTDTFGPCGIGWGFGIVNERMERLSELDVLHVAVVRFWYEHGGKRGELEQIGQTKATYWSAGKDGSGGKLVVDEDAPKKSVTDALVKCASYLGFAGDIFSGMWDDSRYVAFARQHYEEAERQQEPPAPQAMPSDVLADWLNHITESHSTADVKARLADGKAVAEECGDTGAYAQMKAAAKARAAAINAALPAECKEGAAA
jgi:hypothetical protein